MPIDPALSRQIQGHFDRKVADNLQPRGVPPVLDCAAARGPLTVRNGPGLLASWLALSSALAVSRLPSRSPAGRPDAVSSSVRGAALLPVGHAQGNADYQPVPMSSQPLAAAALPLERIANAASATCIAKPKQCPQALLAGTVAAMAVVGSAATGLLVGRATAPACDQTDDAPSASNGLAHALYDLLRAEHRYRLLEIVSDCGTEAAACTGPAIHALLEDLPPADRYRIMATLGVAQRPGTHGVGGWPSGADAAPHAPVLDWMDWAADLLAAAVSPAQARFELDLEQIARATLDAQAASNGTDREAAANNARFDSLGALFEDDGHTLLQLPFNGTARDIFGFERPYIGCNLMLEFSGAGTPSRTLLLLAHGDMTGAHDGSSGANDNGSSLAALLALARTLRDSTLPAGMRVQLMVSDMEERGLYGSKAFVQQCLARGTCPDVALNLDMIGRGEGITLTGSDRHHLYMDGDSRSVLPPAAEVSAAEAQLRQQLERAAADVGLQVFDSSGWAMQSDHIAFQREGIPALGMNLADERDIALEREVQQARARLWVANTAVDWSRFEEYLQGTLDPVATQEMDARLDVMDRAMQAYRALPESPSMARIHNGRDQLHQVNVPRAMDALAVLERTLDAWLHSPAP
ncbi:M28 family peptidase [uncultured Stenotrophomonas sp.]|uniref:M28 family peptidase n=1 Tax=uncultured Stenotrophomonas sp. TaxID=165438 RepID=UPI0028F0989D|nr:M28 family peptidase [uncultured Stenotrophomonas sp.]